MTKKTIEPIEDASKFFGLSAEGQKEAIAEMIQNYADDNKERPDQVILLNFRDWLFETYGKNQGGRIVNTMAQLGTFQKIKDGFFPTEITSQMVERVAVINAAKVNKRFENQEVANAYFMRQMKDTIKGAFKDMKVVIPAYKLPNIVQKSDEPRELNVVLSDLHFQALIKRSETGYQFGEVEEARRLAAIAKVVANYKLDHRAVTNLNVMLLGDVIQNMLHDVQGAVPIAKQVQAATFLLIQLIGYWASAFKKVTIYCATGNHGRNTARHHQRAIHEKYDSLESGIYYSLQLALSGKAPNVKVVIPQTPWVDFTALGHAIYATHGDTGFSPGNPGKSVDVQKLETQVNKINTGRDVKRQPRYEIFVAGHVHRASVVYLDSGTTVFTNAPLCPPDSFAVSIGVNSTACGQWMFETTKSHVLGDSRLILVGEKEDNDASLDRIIKPYTEWSQMPVVATFGKQSKKK